MRFLRLEEDSFGALSCLAFLVSVVFFWFATRHISPLLNFAYVFPSLAGLVLAVIGIIRAGFAKQLSALSIAGAVLNSAPMGLMVFIVYGLAHMH
jgi:hypothetical protein